MRGRTVRSPEKKAAFLAALSETASVTAACKAMKIGRETAYGWRREDKDFAAAWDEAIELGTDALEDEAVRRAHEGTEKPVYQGGKRVGFVREYSDTLLIFMLKARRPAKYRETRVELTGKDGGPVEVAELSPVELARRVAFLLAAGARKAEG